MISCGQHNDPISRLSTAQKAGDGYNPNISACIQNIKTNNLFKSKIDISLINKPVNKNYKYIVKLQLDNISVSLNERNGKYYFESIPLNVGSHFWSVGTYLVNSAEYDGLLKLVFNSEEKIKNYKKLKEDSVLQEDVLYYQNMIDRENIKIDKLNEQLSKLEKKVGDVQKFNFEVKL